jgi:hypothetical protein
LHDPAFDSFKPTQNGFHSLSGGFLVESVLGRVSTVYSGRMVVDALLVLSLHCENLGHEGGVSG